MDTKISATDLEAGLADVLERVRTRGERFFIERDGEVVAVLAPPPRMGITIEELIARVGDLKMPGDGFADDLEEIQSTQGIFPNPKC